MSERIANSTATVSLGFVRFDSVDHYLYDALENTGLRLKVPQLRLGMDGSDGGDVLVSDGDIAEVTFLMSELKKRPSFGVISKALNGENPTIREMQEAFGDDYRTAAEILLVAASRHHVDVYKKGGVAGSQEAFQELEHTEFVLGYLGVPVDQKTSDYINRIVGNECEKIRQISPDLTLGC